jgi:hypothetical protein
MTVAEYKTRDLMHALKAHGIEASYRDAETLRRAERTLHHWAEGECGDPDMGNAIERNEETGLPYRVHHFHPTSAHPAYILEHIVLEITKTLIPDRERGALKRIQAVCKRLGAHYYHQGDPRGCALYVSAEPLTDSAYTRGVACCR